MRVILLAGQIASGKSAVATELAERYHARVVRVRDALAATLGIASTDRHRLQVQGAELDVRTNGRWLAEYISEAAEASFLVVDSMRTVRQTALLLRVTDSALVYLDASEANRMDRYALAAARGDNLKASIPFARAMQHPTEIAVVELRRMASIVISTDDMSVTDAADVLEVELNIRPGGRAQPS